VNGLTEFFYIHPRHVRVVMKTIYIYTTKGEIVLAKRGDLLAKLKRQYICLYSFSLIGHSSVMKALFGAAGILISLSDILR
jgi:hypothetical protein